MAFLGALLAVTILFEWATLRLPITALLSSPFDGHPLNARALRKTVWAQVPVYVVGGSAVREGFLSEESSRAKTTPYRVMKLTSSGQNLMHVAQLIENLGATDSLIVLGLNYIKMTYSTGELSEICHRFDLLRPALNTCEQMGMSGWSTRLGFLRTLGVFGQWQRRKAYFGHRLSALLQEQHLRYQEFVYDALPDKTPEEWAELASRVQDFHDNYRQHAAINFGLLERILSRLAELEKKVLLLELPSNPRAVVVNQPVLLSYKDKLKKLAARFDMPYWDFAQDLGFTSDDYHDYSHLRPGARETFHFEFTRRLTESGLAKRAL